MEEFGNILNQVIKELGIEKPIIKYKALSLWPEAVGERISEVTEPCRLNNGKMFIKVKNDAWRNELVFHKPEIIRKINDELGSRVVRDLILI